MCRRCGCTCVYSDLDVHLSTRRHLVRPDVIQSNVRQAADVDSQRLQSQQQQESVEPRTSALDKTLPAALMLAADIDR